MRIRIEPNDRPTNRLYRFAQWLLPKWYRLNGGWHVFGQDNVPEEGGAIVASNHLSFMDPPAIGCALRRRTYYFAKAELFVPVFGALIRKTYAFPVERGGADTGATREAIRLLREGELMVMFPEGTRSRDGELQELNLGAALLASRAGVPIVPTAVYGTNRVLPVGAKFLHRGRMAVSFGPPIDSQQFGSKPRKDDLMKLNVLLRQAILDLQKQQRDFFDT
ncbi:MAG: 1-acyl-sn-glycerol-3-phosphate acyltransferase [Armatimonadetes bacterium]|nr:1-acyl-sn-glycerol-3-phosphate acyltransferase [Armatimonadota bacterium]